MQAIGQLVTLRAGADAKAVVAPELGGWLLRYMRHLPGHGFVDGLYFSQEVVDRYPSQMYAGMPLLFPMVSYNHRPGNSDHYDWEGKTYALPQHGFARHSRWKVLKVEEDSVAMELTDTPETRLAYPFSFRSVVRYELESSRLVFRQSIENRSTTPMSFSTGVHPYFPVPMNANSRRADCYLEIPAARQIVPAENWTSWGTNPQPAQKLSVQKDVSGTLFLTDLERPEISMVDSRASLKITFNFAEAPRHRYVALWSKGVSEPYYCIEPWTALPNSFERGSELVLLGPGERFEAAMWISISRL